tara:strand:- start:43 stop:597 length:555 start_codon:yes stop_codon:yes gene_type:complete
MTDINKDLENNFNQAEKLRSTGDYEGAIKLLLNILEKKENFLPVLNSIANCYFQLNKFDLAEKYYLKCLKIDPENTTLLNNISLLYLKTKNFKKALSTLELSLKKDYNQENIVEKIAYCLTGLSSFNELDEFCKTYLTIYPNNKTILSYYRRNLFKIGKYKKALEVYQKETGVIEFNDDKIKID